MNEQNLALVAALARVENRINRRAGIKPSTMRKRNPTAKLFFKLTEAQQNQLAEWMLEGIPYRVCRERVEKEFGLQVRSLDTFSLFYQEVCLPIRQARREAMAAKAPLNAL